MIRKYEIRSLRFLTFLIAFMMVMPLLNLANAQSSDKNDTTDLFRNVKFRNIGPAIAGGRVSSVVGIPGKPNVYYIGSAAGGVWKTTNGGSSWKDIFAKEPVSSIGSIALAPSNPNLVWVGTGEANIRNDITNGHGVYFSPDAGNSWQFMGLKNAGQIAKVAIDPQNPKVVFVAAIGDAWGPNKERGLFKTTDGGKTWKKVLFVNDSTGVSDVIFKPGNPEVMFASTWQVMRRPWTLIDGGKGSGIYRSTDGGNTWKKLTNGLPKGNIGRIDLAAAPSDPNHIYALMGTDSGILWDTHDGGNHWTKVTNNHLIDVRPFYFSTMEVDPKNENKVYFLSEEMSVSTDGGKTAKAIAKGVHVDFHTIWIDPTNPNRIIIGNDGGVYISNTDAKTWHYCDNIPIEQFYEVALGNGTPFHLGGGLQDNNSWYGTSNNLHNGDIDGSSWFVTAGGDGEYVVPAPSNPHIVYSEAQDGYANRMNLKTGVKRYIRPIEPSSSEFSPADLKYRFNWTTPIAVSYTNANTVYMGADKLLKSTNGGFSWKAISPDLTRNNKKTQVVAGGPVMHDISGAENYGTISSISISPQNPNVIWVGTDDGNVQVTKNGGKTWINATKYIRHFKAWGRFYQIDVSPFNPGTCYLAYDRHMMNDPRPYAYKVTDYGKHWKFIANGLPDDMPVHVVREDPNKKGFLVLGNDIGLYYSHNDGKTWTKIKSNFPTAPVWDLKFQKRDHDLVVATHGRGLFIMDDIRPLEEMNHKVKNSSFKFFSIQPAVMLDHTYTGGFGEPGRYSAPNPPSGAIIDYYLKHSIKPNKKEKKAHKTAVKIIITNSEGQVVNTLYAPAKVGVNRFIWNLRYKGPNKLKIFGKPHEKSANNSGGPRVLPGNYNVSVTVNGKTQTQTLTVKPDPNIPFNMEAAKDQQKAIFSAISKLSELNNLLNRIHSIHTQIDNIKQTINNVEGDHSGQYKSVIKMADKLNKKIIAMRDTLILTKYQRHVPEDDLHYLSHFYSWLQGVMYDLYGYDAAPRPSEMSFLKKLDGKLQGYVNKFNNVLNTDIPSFNQAAKADNLPTLFAGKPIGM